MLASRPRSKVMVTLTTRLGSVDPEKATDRNFADADAIHPHRRSRSQPGGVGNVEIHGGLLVSSDPPVSRYASIERINTAAAQTVKTRNLAQWIWRAGGHSIGLYRFQGHRANADALRPLAMPQRATAIWRAYAG